MPPAGAVVVIPAGKTVVLDMQTPALRGLTVQGNLVAGDADIGITSDFVYVEGGRLQIGSAQTPFLRKATITLTGTSTAQGSGAPGFGSKVLAVMGGTLELHGSPVAKTWTKLDGGDIAAGTRQIRLAAAPGWKAGDQIVIATSTFEQDAYSLVEIESISGSNVTLRQATSHKHFGAVRTVGDITIDVRAEVGLLTRNIVIQGDAASSALNIGGHAMFMADSNGVTVQIAHAQFQRMGQLDRLGRYPLHFHIIGNQCKACYVRNSTVRDSIQRGIVVHDTSNVLVAGNVVFNTVGHNIVIETESTNQNTLDGNLALVNRQPSPPFTEPTLVLQNDRLPGNYWLKGAMNTVVNNVAAGSFSNGFIYDNPGVGDFDFRNNVVHAAMSREGTGAGDFDTTAGLMILAGRTPSQRDRITDTLAYHNAAGIWPEESSAPFVFDRFIVAENGTGVQNRGVGSKQIYRNGVFIGRLPNSTVPGINEQHAMHNQYGSDNVLESPTFGNYPDGVGLGGTDTNPAQSSYRLSNARFLGANTGIALGGDTSRLFFADDSVMPRGFYVDATAPWLAPPGCPVVTVSAERTFRCPSEPGIAELELRMAANATFGQKIAAQLTRNDGLRYAIGSPGPSSGMHSTTVLHSVPGLSYQLDQTGAFYALRLFDIGGDASIASGVASTLVSVAVTAPPRTVARMSATQEVDNPGGDTGVSGDPLPVPKPSNALRALASLAELTANPMGGYFHDRATGRLWLGVSSRWVVVSQ